MDREVAPPVPFWLRVPGLASSEGTALDLELKAWGHTESRCLWELRRVWEGVTIHGCKRKYMHTWLWERRQLLEQEFRALGLVSTEHVIASKKAQASKQRAISSEGELHEEWTCTSTGLLVFLHICANCLKGLQQKHSSQTILSAVLDRCGSHVQISEFLSALTTSLHCGLREPEQPRCVHLQQLLGLEASSASTPLKVWQLLFSLWPSCATLKAEIANVLLLIGEQLSRAVAEVACTSDPLHGSKRAIDHKDVEVKRRRSDEDYRTHIVRETRQSLRAGSARAMVRAHEGVNKDNKVADWEDKDSLQYMLSGWMVPTGTSFSLAVDASRLGKPAEETLVGIALAGSGEGLWLPPQAKKKNCRIEIVQEKCPEETRTRPTLFP
eukprot:6484142-Amphidinium_carterae.2